MMRKVELMFSLFKKKQPFVGEIGGRSCTLNRQSTILDSILSEGMDVPYSCQVGACRQCLVQVKQGKARSLIDLGVVLSQEQLSQGYILACQAIPQSDLVLDFTQDNHAASVALGALASIQQLNDYVFRVTINTPLAAQIGQSVMVTIPASGQGRFYSIAAKPEGQIVLDIARQEQGICSTWLTDQRHLAQPVELGEPKGRFGGSVALRKHCVAIAGGSALGMVLGVLEQHLLSCSIQDVTLIHAVRTRSHAYDLERLERMRATYSGFEYLIALSRDVYEDGQFIASRVPAWLQQRCQRQAAAEHYLMCGSDSLVQACLAILKTHWVETPQWEAESFGANSIG